MSVAATARRRAAGARAGSASLLLEVGTEELPPKALRELGEALAAQLHRRLLESDLLEAVQAGYDWFATPRRLAVRVPHVRRRQPDRRVERRGPAVRAAFDAQGRPTAAALGFARSCGVDIDRLERVDTDKGSWLVLRERQRGAAAAELLPACVDDALKALPIPKRMRWGAGDSEFVRPVHWVVLLHGARVVRTVVLSVETGRGSRGHRFHAPGRVDIANADDYAEAIASKGHIIPAFDQRRAHIRRQLRRLAARRGAVAVIDEELLEEVTGLVEWPQPIMGEIDPEFMEVPPEVLISSMRDHQKYFHVTTPDGHLLPFFIAVSNIKSKAPRRVRDGNERVLRARLADARFFWEADRRISLQKRVDALADVTFHNKLGSLAEKSERLRIVARRLAAATGGDEDSAARAAWLAKADLVSDMVGEFPQLQGTMGRYYALHDGETEEVAAAIAEHYRPRFAGDALPETATGCIVALSDKLDTLVGIFATGEEPSGDRDPFGLRRAALGVLRILIEKHLDIDLEQAIAASIAVYAASAERIPDAQTRLAFDESTLRSLLDFLLDRLRAYYADAGFAADEIAAVRACRPTRPHDFDRRLRAVASFRAMDAAHALSEANKRIRNILRKAGYTGGTPADAALFRERAERQLAQRVAELEAEVTPLLREGAYEQALSRLASLREPIDRFFDEVMVMADEEDVRNNRLAMLSGVSRLFLGIADVSRLQG